jgi:hypothetical protein
MIVILPRTGVAVIRTWAHDSAVHFEWEVIMSRWWIKADYIETCNCAHGCPCNLTQIPTHGGCDAVVGYRIKADECDGVDLGGLTLGYVASWPGAIHHGNGHSVVIIDERASEPQRKALTAIARGEAGPGGPFEIFASTMAEPAEVVVGKADFKLDGKRGLLKFADVAEANVGPIVGDMGDEANARMVLPQGFIFQDAAIANTDSGRARSQRVDFTLADSNAFLSEVAYNV